MKLQRVFLLTLAVGLSTLTSSPHALGQWAGIHSAVPGYHPAASPYAVMMGQEFADPAAAAAANWGDTCCGPAWYDASVEAAYFKREDAGRTVNFASDGIAGVGPPNVVLSNDDLDYDHQPGVRAFFRYQLGAVHNIEAGYLGVLDWREESRATSSNRTLYSAFSQFGNSPLGGYVDFGSDQATLQAINYRSDLDSVELNMRRSWTMGNHRLHGSWLGGIRYVRLYEKFQYESAVLAHFDPVNMVNVNDANMHYNVLTKNDLIGFQLGGDLTLCVIPGVIVGGEFKAGAFGNSTNQDTGITSTGLNSPIIEAASSDDAALVAEAGAFLRWQIHPLVKIRAGYQALYIDGVALATENFNAQSPFTGNARTALVNDNGSAFYHGGLMGLEIGW